jgi:hypothetical protein
VGGGAKNEGHEKCSSFVKSSNTKAKKSKAMLSFLTGGIIGEFLAPPRSAEERLADFLRRGQEVSALALLQNCRRYVDGGGAGSGGGVTLIDVEARSPDDGLCAIHRACALGMVDVVDELIRLCADIESVDPYGRTPLLVAARAGHPPVIDTLLRCDADPYARDDDGLDVIALTQNPELRDHVRARVRTLKESTKSTNA